MNKDDRGSFTELVHTLNCGQVSINISRPGITKGQHWHNTKWEFFIVVSGHGLIQERDLNTGKLVEFEVTGDEIQCIHMLPGYTHNIINLSETENLVTVMYCNEIFDPNHPDTFFDPVVKEQYRWKRRIVYKEGVFIQFVSSSYAHLNHWNTIKD